MDFGDRTLTQASIGKPPSGFVIILKSLVYLMNESGQDGQFLFESATRRFDFRKKDDLLLLKRDCVVLMIFICTKCVRIMSRKIHHLSRLILKQLFITQVGNYILFFIVTLFFKFFLCTETIFS